MKTRCIHLFPEFKNLTIIEDVRNKFDPLVEKIPPHITLVFPFDSDFTKEDLINHLKDTLRGVRKFHISLRYITSRESYGFYLFLNVEDGFEKIKELHQKLYSGLLSSIKPDWLNHDTYEPHITVGKLETKELMIVAEKECKKIINTFETKISKVVVEVIGDDEKSIIEYEYQLN